jgi:hypothetical protein
MTTNAIRKTARALPNCPEGDTQPEQLRLDLEAAPGFEAQCASAIQSTCVANDRPRTAQDDLAARFWTYVRRRGPDDCWIWRGQMKDGYGRFGRGRSRRYAHRLAWELTHGEISVGLCVLHRCDRPPCCNTAHLFLGTQAENMADRDRKGRGWWQRDRRRYKRPRAGTHAHAAPAVSR